MKRKLKMGFLMDPIERILPDKDTTFVFILEAGKRNHEILYFTPADIYTEKNEPFAAARHAKVMRSVPHYEVGDPSDLRLRDLDVLFMRADPPFTLDYLSQTYFLDLIENDVFVTNRPGAIRDANEKMFALHFPGLIPPTIVTHEARRIKNFLEEAGPQIVIKPLFGCGGAGIFVVKQGDRNLNVILETATEEGKKRVMAQKYVPEVREGDKRIIMLDGKALGATARVPKDEEHRANIHVGGTCVSHTLTKRDREIVDTVGPVLREKGIHFAGLDVLGDWLTEINVTSPTGIQEIDRLDNVCLEAQVIDFVEEKAG